MLLTASRKQHNKQTKAKQTSFKWTKKERGDPLQQSFGLPRRVFRFEVFVGFYFVFYGEQLSLQFVPEVGQGVSNMVGKLLNKTQQNQTCVWEWRSAREIDFRLHRCSYQHPLRTHMHIWNGQHQRTGRSSVHSSVLSLEMLKSPSVNYSLGLPFHPTTPC